LICRIFLPEWLAAHWQFRPSICQT
jgi:hypothetical protein